MNKLTITEAAKLAGISRQHLYKKYINNGALSITKDCDKSFIEMSELLRVFPDLSLDVNYVDKNLHVLTPPDDTISHVIDSKNQTIKILEKQLIESTERELWLQEQINELRATQIKFIEDNSVKKIKRWILF